MEWLDVLISTPFWVAAVRMATPLIFATLGELVCERAGVLNLGIEGIMTMGALVGWVAVFMGADPWIGVAFAALTGSAFGLLHGVITGPLGVSQHVTGLAITMLGAGLSAFSFRLLVTDRGSVPQIDGFQRVEIPFLADLPVIGQGFFNQTAMTYLAFITAAVVYYVLFKTPIGLAVRMVGENPKALLAQGLSPHKVRVGAVVAGSALMAVGGCFLSLAAYKAFYIDMAQGRGWICIALVILAGWRPGMALVAALAFGAIQAFQLSLQQTPLGEMLPHQLFLAAPYIVSIAILVIAATLRLAPGPKSLLVPYRAQE